MNGIRVKDGTLYFFFAYDVGFDVDLSAAKALCAARESPGLSGHRPTPPYIQYRPRPLVVPLGRVPVETAGGPRSPEASVKIFDFGALSVTLALPVGDAGWDDFSALALALSAGNAMEEAARGAAARIFERIRPAVTRGDFSDLVEEYALWHVAEFSPTLSGGEALARLDQEIARLLTLEAGPFSGPALSEILKTPIRYFENDLLVAEWSAAFAYDPRIHDTAEVLEFLNVQMLELRFFDRILHAAIDAMAEELRKSRGILSVLHDPYEKPLRRLSEIKIDVAMLRERIGNALKISGDVYLARVYDEARRKTGTDRWEATIRDQLKTLEDIYVILNNRAAASRAETLELVIILLIAIEIVMGLLRR